MARLRAPDGCPWDREQSFATIAPFTIEEAYEVDDAIRRAHWPDLREELGDLLLQVVFHAQMAREAGRFDFADVVRGLSEKLVRRHPHVFGGASAADADEVLREWEKHKQAERAARGGRRARRRAARAARAAARREARAACRARGRGRRERRTASRCRSTPRSPPPEATGWATSCSRSPRWPEPAAWTPRRRCATPAHASRPPAPERRDSVGLRPCCTGCASVELASELGSLCGQILADLGADVVLVEPPGGSPQRRRGPFWKDEPDPERSLPFWAWARGKRSAGARPRRRRRPRRARAAGRERRLPGRGRAARPAARARPRLRRARPREPGADPRLALARSAATARRPATPGPT